MPLYNAAGADVGRSEKGWQLRGFSKEAVNNCQTICLGRSRRRAQEFRRTSKLPREAASAPGERCPRGRACSPSGCRHIDAKREGPWHALPGREHAEPRRQTPGCASVCCARCQQRTTGARGAGNRLRIGTRVCDRLAGEVDAPARPGCRARLTPMGNALGPQTPQKLQSRVACGA